MLFVYTLADTLWVSSVLPLWKATPFYFIFFQIDPEWDKIDKSNTEKKNQDKKIYNSGTLFPAPSAQSHLALQWGSLSLFQTP